MLHAFRSFFLLQPKDPEDDVVYDDVAGKFEEDEIPEYANEFSQTNRRPVLKVFGK